MGLSMVQARTTESLRGHARSAVVVALGTLAGVVAVALAGKSNLSLVIALAVPVAVVGLFLMLTRFDWLLVGVLLTRASLEPVFTLIKGDSEGMGPGAAINVVVILLGVLYFLRRPRGFARFHILVWLAFLSLAAAGTRYAPDPSNALRMLMVYLTYFIVFAVPSVIITKRADTRFWVKLLLVASIVPTVLGVVDMATGGISVAEPELDAGADGVDGGDVITMPEYTGFRIEGAFSHPNIYAFFLVTLIGVLLYALRQGYFERSSRTRWLGYGYLGLQGVLLLATQTRGAWAGAALLVLAYAVFVDRRFLLYLALAAIPLMFVPVVQDRVVEIFTGGAGKLDDALNSYQWRLAMWKSALPWIQDRPLLGWGLDSYTEYSRIFFPLEYLVAFDAHNVYVQLAFELGLPAVGAFVSIFLGMLVVAWRYFRVSRVESVLLAASVLAYLMACYSDNMHRYLVSNWYTFFFMGLLCATATLPRTPTDEARA